MDGPLESSLAGLVATFFFRPLLRLLPLLSFFADIVSVWSSSSLSLSEFGSSMMRSDKRIGRKVRKACSTKIVVGVHANKCARGQLSKVKVLTLHRCNLGFEGTMEGLRHDWMMSSLLKSSWYQSVFFVVCWVVYGGWWWMGRQARKQWLWTVVEVAGVVWPLSVDGGGLPRGFVLMMTSTSKMTKKKRPKTTCIFCFTLRSENSAFYPLFIATSTMIFRLTIEATAIVLMFLTATLSTISTGAFQTQSVSTSSVLSNTRLHAEIHENDRRTFFSRGGGAIALALLGGTTINQPAEASYTAYSRREEDWKERVEKGGEICWIVVIYRWYYRRSYFPQSLDLCFTIVP